MKLTINQKRDPIKDTTEAQLSTTTPAVVSVNSITLNHMSTAITTDVPIPHVQTTHRHEFVDQSSIGNNHVYSTTTAETARANERTTKVNSLLSAKLCIY